jgi:hypothetical protein
MSESQRPNPFSREGSQPPSDGLGGDPDPGAAAQQPYQSPAEASNPGAGDWPSYPAEDPYGRSTADPYGRSAADPYGPPGETNSMYAGPAHGFNVGPSAPYADPDQSYPYNYGSTPYEANPYQPAFGGVSPYGSMPREEIAQTQHPQATLALILGLLGTVLGLSCIVGGLVGIGGIVVGRRVRNEIDAEPGRYTGRSQAVAGIVTGIVGVSIFALVTVLIVLAVVAGISNADF